MEEGSIADKVKGTMSITDVAERLNVSRPSLYKYMDNYDRGDYESIPARVLEFFTRIDSGEASKDDVEQGLLEQRMMSDRQRLRMMRDLSSPSEDRFAWTRDEVPTMMVNDRSGSTVMFRNAVAGGWDAVVRVSVVVDGTPSEIARFDGQKGMGFVRLSGLPVGPRYQYIAELRRGGETRSSEPHQFSSRGSQ